MTSVINLVLIDTCAWIRIWQGSITASKFLSFILNHGYTLVVPEDVTNELCHKLEQTKDKIMSWILRHKPKELRIVHYTTSSSKEASELSRRYGFCHFPDNRLLAFCKINEAMLVTYDRNLLLTAELEGVLACTPENFRRYVE